MSHTSETNSTTRDNVSFPTSIDDHHDELMASLSADTIIFGTRRIRTPATLPAFATVRGTLTSHHATPSFPHAAATTPYQLDTARDLSAVSPELHSELTASLAADTIVLATPSRRQQGTTRLAYHI
ncbi:hypothetical protein BDZ85DRAFT_254263 [Elsinoe ampelina]|uniref:Uncharacterized protein n=1 Tax=Elsinoe ampelina TaxID=302913 RepID=A0A6A6GP14_9PEZI|nr:hypothetical protein BDZ85DRAFT_254263 [Elsinoe ampelina]